MTKEFYNNYSNEFKKTVATEAYSATPRGGYPEVAEKYNIQVELVFDWVKLFFPPTPSPFSAQHVWIGTSEKSENDFHRYFNYADDYYAKVEGGIECSPQDTGCAFCIDLNSNYLYDGDFLFYFYSAYLIPSEEIIKELPLSTKSCRENILIACLNLGIKTANAIFSYADPSTTIENKSKPYNGLIYLGLFQDR